MCNNGLVSKRLNMEYETIVFNAARDGKLYRLKVFLDHIPKEKTALLVSTLTNGSTPLVIACRYGHLDVAIYLIEKCRVDIEQTGSVIFDGETVEGAPPLWCAAAAGSLKLVKCLLKYKASVNSVTKSNSTPLRAACFDGNFEIAKCLISNGADMEIANKHGHTCLMIACYKGHFKVVNLLIDCGVDVNRKSPKGFTALHDCAESGHLHLLKLLLENGATFISDSSSITPPLTAALTGHATVVEYFVKKSHCTKQEKINALELLGATVLDTKRDMISALDYWRRAMKLRYEDIDCLIEKPKTRSPIASYVDMTEVRTLSELEELLSNPDELKMQALLVRERILGPGLPDNLYYIRKRGAIYADNGFYDKCIQLWMYALDVQQKAQEPLSIITQGSISSFSDLFSRMMSNVHGRGYQFVSFRDIFRVFERALKDIETAKEVSLKKNQNSNESAQLHRFLTVTMYLVGLMCRLQPGLSKSEDLELKKAVHRLVHLNLRAEKGWTPLHIACSKDTPCVSRYRAFGFPSPEVVELLLEVGASPNALDSNHNTPLHIAVMNKPFVQAIFNSLLNHGAHLDQCNNKKQTPLQLAQNTPLLDIHPLQYVNLQCLSAKVVQSHKIPYKELVHKALELFIDAH